MAVNFRPGVRPQDHGDPSLYDLLGTALDSYGGASRAAQDRAVQEEARGYERQQRGISDALTQAELQARGIRRRPSEFEAPAAPELEAGDPFAAQQLGLAGEERDVGMFEGATMGMGRTSPSQPQIYPGQFMAEVGGFVKDPVAFRMQSVLAQEPGPDGIPLTDEYEMHPGATPAARQARAQEMESAQARAQTGELAGILEGVQAGDGAALSALLARRPDLIDNVPGFLGAEPQQPKAYAPTTLEEKLELERGIEGIRYPQGRFPGGRGGSRGGAVGMTVNQAMEQLKDLYAERDEYGDITGYSVPGPKMYELAQEMARGGAFPDPAAEPDVTRGFIRAGGAEGGAPPNPELDDQGVIPRSSDREAPGLSPAQLQASDSALTIMRDFPGVPEDQLRIVLEEEGYEPEVIDYLLTTRPQG